MLSESQVDLGDSEGVRYCAVNGSIRYKGLVYFETPKCRAMTRYAPCLARRRAVSLCSGCEQIAHSLAEYSLETSLSPPIADMLG